MAEGEATLQLAADVARLPPQARKDFAAWLPRWLEHMPEAELGVMDASHESRNYSVEMSERDGGPRRAMILWNSCLCEGILHR